MNDQCNLKDYTVFTRVSLFLDWIMIHAKGAADFPVYVCKDYSRIPFTRKCRNKPDCLDGDDEETCSE